MGFIGITDAEIAPDMPVSNDLLKKVKDNFDDHEARLLSGGGGSGGGNLGTILNGSFESDADSNGVPDNWTRYLYPSGSSAIDASDSIHGKKSYKFVHPGGSGCGGGHLESDYIAVSPLYLPDLPFAWKASAAGMKVAVLAMYYAADANGDPSTKLGEQTIWYTLNNPSKWCGITLTKIPLPYTSAKYIKYRLIGGYYDTNVAGSVWFDGVGVSIALARRQLTDSIVQAQVYANYGSWQDVGSTFTLTIPNPAVHSHFALYGEMCAQEIMDWGYPTCYFRAHVFQQSGTPFNLYGASSAGVQGANYAGGVSYIDISSLLSGTYALRFQDQVNNTGSNFVYLRSPYSTSHFFTARKLTYDCMYGTTTEYFG